MTDITDITLEDLDLLVRDILSLRRMTSDLTGACVGLLHSIDRAGGWHVFDPAHQEPVGRAMRAVEAAAMVILETRHKYNLPLGPSACQGEESCAV